MNNFALRLVAMTTWHSLWTVLAATPFVAVLLIVAENLKNAEIGNLGIEAVFFGILIDHAYEEAYVVVLGFVALAWKNTRSIVRRWEKLC